MAVEEWYAIGRVLKQPQINNKGLESSQFIDCQKEKIRKDAKKYYIMTTMHKFHLRMNDT